MIIFRTVDEQGSSKRIYLTNDEISSINKLYKNALINTMEYYDEVREQKLHNISSIISTIKYNDELEDEDNGDYVGYHIENIYENVEYRKILNKKILKLNKYSIAEKDNMINLQDYIDFDRLETELELGYIEELKQYIKISSLKNLYKYYKNSDIKELTLLKEILKEIKISKSVNENYWFCIDDNTFILN